MQLTVQKNASLKNHNSFAVQANAANLVCLDDVRQLKELTALIRCHQKHLVLGHGSNVLFIGDYPGLVIINRLKGKTLLRQTRDGVQIRVCSGNNWHDWVRWSLARGYFGLENLSLIPGTVGAAPVQNIGAYGVELKQFVTSIQAIDLQNGCIKQFDSPECQFTYRNSLFKAHPDRYLILSVTFELRKQFKPDLSYSGVEQQLAKMDLDIDCLNALQLSDAIGALRRSKFPLPDKLANAGSFFKNPLITAQQYASLVSRYPHLSAHPQPPRYKIPAAWLIEQCGWKGCRHHAAGVCDSHALVLVNHGGASGRQIWDLACRIRLSVQAEFGIDLQPEPRIV